MAVPAVEQAVEGAEQEVAGAAGGVDELEAFEGPLFEGWFEGAVEDEFLDEDRGLQQRVGVLGVLGQVLVQVAEEAGGQRAVRQVVDERAVIVAAAPEVEQPRYRVTGRRDELQRGVRVDQRLRRGQPGEVVDRCMQPFAVGVLGVLAEERELGVEGFLAAVSGPGDPDRRTSALSSQKRMNTLVSTHATAAWVIRSSRQVTHGAAVRPCHGPLVLLLPAASRSGSAVTRVRRSSSRTSTCRCRSVVRAGSRSRLFLRASVPAAAGWRCGPPCGQFRPASCRPGRPGR